MKNHELLDMIGDVSEEYVQGADSNVVRPRFRWKTLAACAACAALVLGAYPVYQAANPPLHDYAVMEGGGTLETDLNKEAKAPAGSSTGTPGQGAPDPAPASTSGSGSVYDPNPNTLPGGAYIGGDAGESGIDGAHYSKPGLDTPVQEAALWYDALMKTYRLDENPEWYGGAWIAGERLLAVAIVDGFHTPELEAEIQEAAGEGAVLRFSTVKYSMEFLNGLMEPAVRALDSMDLCAAVGVDVMANCLGVDLYSVSDTFPDRVLAALAHLDPDGDAIRVRVFTGKISTYDYDETAMKDPASADSKAIATPSAGSTQPAGEPSVAPGGVTQPTVNEFPETKENSVPAYTENG